jgi:hypothetical protein
MKDLYWYKTCPFCKQGRLFVFKNTTLNKLYLHCEECERGYYNIDDVSSSNSFLTLEENFESTEANLLDIKSNNWEGYELNKVSE